MISSDQIITVPRGKTKERIDLFLTHHIENVTRSKIHEAIIQGFVTVNGEVIKPSHKVSPGEIVAIHLPKTAPPDVLAEKLPLDIIYEDEYLIVLNKAAGMVTHPAYANYQGTLVNALMYYCQENLSQINNEPDPGSFPRPGIVHRLDKDTSGLMVVAKDDYTHAQLAKQFTTRDIGREYWAIVWGVFSGSSRKKNQALSGTIDAPLGRSTSDRKKIAVVTGGKAAVTDYKVLEEFDYLSLVQCKLRTGRTHQIRVHMAHTGHPVFGDATYGGRKISWGDMGVKQKKEVHELLKLMPRQALHAKTIGFIHPATGKRVSFDSELPEDMKSVLKYLKNI
ncbi:MAG: RluA family pseudouridine synthase [Bacteroidota bacterium]